MATTVPTGQSIGAVGVREEREVAPPSEPRGQVKPVSDNPTSRVESADKSSIHVPLQREHTTVSRKDVMMLVSETLESAARARSEIDRSLKVMESLKGREEARPQKKEDVETDEAVERISRDSGGGRKAAERAKQAKAEAEEAAEEHAQQLMAKADAASERVQEAKARALAAVARSREAKAEAEAAAAARAARDAGEGGKAVDAVASELAVSPGRSPEQAREHAQEHEEPVRSLERLVAELRQGMPSRKEPSGERPQVPSAHSAPADHRKIAAYDAAMIGSIRKHVDQMRNDHVTRVESIARSASEGVPDTAPAGTIDEVIGQLTAERQRLDQTIDALSSYEVKRYAQPEVREDRAERLAATTADLMRRNAASTQKLHEQVAPEAVMALLL